MGSRRQYTTPAEVLSATGLTVADADITLAEQLIDNYVGYQDQFLDVDYANVIEGLAQSGTTATKMVLEQRHSSVFLIDFFKFCELEIIGGAGAGQRLILSGNTYPNTFVTFRDTPSPAPDATSFYRIYQPGKFPRKSDVYLDAINPPTPTYYKNIPINIRDATIAQVEFMKTMPSQFFTTDDMFKNQERIGDYMYAKARDGSGDTLNQIIAPKAKMLLIGYINRKGTFIVDD